MSVPAVTLAVPCSPLHVQFLPRLLLSVSQSSVPPAAVLIRVSGWEDTTVELRLGHVHVAILGTSVPQNAAQNRNALAVACQTDLISFLDADDVGHPKRLEMVSRALASAPLGAVVHDYATFSDDLDAMQFLSSPLDGMPALDPDLVDRCVATSDYPTQAFHRPYHAAHVTCRREIVLAFGYPTDDESVRREDSLFLRAIVQGGASLGRVNGRLSGYFVPPPPPDVPRWRRALRPIAARLNALPA